MITRFSLEATAFAVRLATLGLVALVSIGPSMPAFAKEGDSYICEIKGGGRVKEAFPEIVGVAVGSEAQGAIVRDPIINYYHDGPIPAKIVADTDARLSLRWVVDITNESTGWTAINMQYDLRIKKSDLSARLHIQNSIGDSLEFSAPGTCFRESW